MSLTLSPDELRILCGGALTQPRSQLKRLRPLRDQRLVRGVERGPDPGHDGTGGSARTNERRREEHARVERREELRREPRGPGRRAEKRDAEPDRGVARAEREHRQAHKRERAASDRPPRDE